MRITFVQKTNKSSDISVLIIGPTIEEERMQMTFLMSGALREHLARHSDAGVVIAGVLQSTPTLHPFLPDTRRH